MRRHVLLAAGAAMALAAATPVRAQDAAAGEKLFKSVCAACHTVAAGKNIVGPSLFGLVGRKAGTVPGFRYSEPNKNSNMTWDQASLDKYLENPRGVIPGTTMTFAGVKDAQRRQDLIAYLTAQH